MFLTVLSGKPRLYRHFVISAAALRKSDTINYCKTTFFGGRCSIFCGFRNFLKIRVKLLNSIMCKLRTLDPGVDNPLSAIRPIYRPKACFKFTFSQKYASMQSICCFTSDWSERRIGLTVTVWRNVVGTKTKRVKKNNVVIQTKKVKSNYQNYVCINILP